MNADKVYIGETGRPIKDRIKEHDQDIRLACTDLRRLRLRPDNINRDSGIEIQEAWMPTIKKHNRRALRQRTAKGENHRVKQQGSNAPIRVLKTNQSQQSIMLYNITHDQSTSSSEND